MEATRRKKLTIILLASLLVITAVGATLALMSKQLAPKTNYFNMKTDGVVDGEIIEEGWDDDPNQGQDAYPGASFEKGVRIKNTSPQDDMYVWAAVKMEIKWGPEGNHTDLAAGDLDKILKVMTPVYGTTGQWYNDTDWERQGATATTPIREEEIFVYKVKIPNSGPNPDDVMTSRVFDKIQILLSATDDDMKEIFDNNGFSLIMSGAVIQGYDGDSLDAIRDELVALLN